MRSIEKETCEDTACMREIEHDQTHGPTFMIYERGAMTLDTNGRRANPYCAAPRQVAVSASDGRAITFIRDPN